VQPEPGEIDTSFAAGSRVANLQSRVEATPHLWGLIGIVYACLALFALVVVLDVAHP
jgi:hypothetical protein